MWLSFLLIITSLFILTVYSLMVVLFYSGWKKTKDFSSETIRPSTNITIVIAARNEETRIGMLLSDIAVMDYPKAKFEVIVVDDGSEDHTEKEVLMYMDAIPLRYIKQNHKGKKAAMEKGVGEAKHELIVTTDADCRVPAGWLRSIAAFYEQEKPDMIIAPVKKTGDGGFLHSFQTLDLYSMVASGAGAAWWNHPVLCNGANLVFKKSVFLSFADPLFRGTPSGDDIFLMLNCKAAQKNIKFIKSQEVLVSTVPQLSWPSFFRQRLRWSSKSRFYRDRDIILVALIVMLTSLLTVLLFAVSLINPWLALAGAIMIAVKSAVDYPLLKSYCRFTGQDKLLKWFIPIQCIYPFYIVFAGIAGLFIRVSWKKVTH